MASHSGEYFTKFQDYEFLTAFELAHALRQMHRLGRYHRMLLVLDTCKAATLTRLIDAPDIVALASSGLLDDGRAHTLHFNHRAMVSTADAMTSELFDFVAAGMMAAAGGSASGSGGSGGGGAARVKLPSATMTLPSTMTLRALVTWLQRNRHIQSIVTESHTAKHFTERGEKDVLATSSWTVRDFFAGASRESSSSDASDDDFFIWDDLA